jgi:hypothetical protein
VRPVGLSLLMALALAGCAASRLDTPLAGLDLNDPAVVSGLQQGLSAQDRGTLAVYALLHWPGSRAFCGDALFGADGRPPVTLGDALRLTRERERAEAAAQVARSQPRSAGEKLLEARDRAISERDLLLARQQVALMQDKTQKTETELKAIKTELQQVNARLEKINRKLTT